MSVTIQDGADFLLMAIMGVAFSPLLQAEGLCYPLEIILLSWIVIGTTLLAAVKIRKSMV